MCSVGATRSASGRDTNQELLCTRFGLEGIEGGVKSSCKDVCLSKKSLPSEFHVVFVCFLLVRAAVVVFVCC